MARLAHASLLSLATIYYFAALGCSSSNDPSTPDSKTAGTSSSTPTAGSSSTINVGGSSSAAGSTSQTSGGSAAGGSAPAATAGTGSSTGGSGGAGGGTGPITGTAGSAATGTFMPLCDGLTTTAGPAPTKAGACNANDSQLCYKTCGPQGVGFKSETCTAGAYAEQSGCTFPDDGDYTCFKVPTAVDAACPADTIVASTACSVTACTPCADKTGSYYDSKMNLKTGYCVCPAPATAGGMSKWSCASDTAWPCPTGKGC